MIPTLRLLLKVSLPLLLITPLFWWYPLDLEVAGLWYDGDWSAAQHPLWQLLYQGIPVLSSLLLVVPLVLLTASLWIQRLQRWRPVSTALLLTLILGPGLLVNGIFKDHWGRPRPRQVEALGGEQQYQPPFKPNFGGNGKSFPCGHCSVGFSLYTLALLSPTPLGQLGWAVGATLLGGATGAARMAAGGHFLSDVLWSAWFTFLASWLSVRWIQRSSDRPAWLRPATLQRYRWQLAGGGAAVALLLTSASLLSTPADTQLQLGWRQHPPKRLVIDQGELEIRVVDDSADSGLLANVKGFGWPGSTLHSLREGDELQIKRQGLFTEYDAHYQLMLPETLSEELEVVVEQGGIHLPQQSPEQWSLTLVAPGHLVVAPLAQTGR